MTLKEIIYQIPGVIWEIIKRLWVLKRGFLGLFVIIAIITYFQEYIATILGIGTILIFIYRGLRSLILLIYHRWKNPIE